MLREIINRNVVCLDHNVTLAQAAKKMAEANIGCVVITDSNGRPEGIVTDRDIVIRGVAADLELQMTPVLKIMSDHVETCHETDGFFDAIQKMRDSKVRRIPVVDSNGVAIGIVSFGDVLAVLSKELYELTSTTTAAEEIEQRAA